MLEPLSRLSMALCGSLATALATVDIDSNTSAPSLVTSDMASDPDAYVKISVRVTQTSAGTPFTAILSVNLLVRMD